MHNVSLREFIAGREPPRAAEIYYHGDGDHEKNHGYWALEEKPGIGARRREGTAQGFLQIVGQNERDHKGQDGDSQPHPQQARQQDVAVWFDPPFSSPLAVNLAAILE